jgi:CHAT domain-containing protein
MLRRDAELEYGMTIIWAQYFSVISKKIGLMDFDDTFFKDISKNIDESVEHLQQVIVLTNKIKKMKTGGFIQDAVFQTSESKAYSFLGLAYGIKGKFSDAQDCLDTSTKLARKANNNIAEADSIFFHNHVYLMEKNKTGGQEAARDLLKMAEKYHLPFYQIWAKFVLARYYYSGYGDTAKAITLLKEAVVFMEKQYSDIVIEPPRNTYMFSRQVLYESLIDLLVKEGNYSGAWETAERSKSAELVELIANKDIGKTAAESELIRQSISNIGEMADGYKKLLNATSNNAEMKIAISKIEKAENSQRDLLSKIKEQNEELYPLLTVEETNCEDIRQLLDKNTTLFSYYQENNVLYIWALNKDRIHLERIKISREDVAKLVWAYNAAITSRDIDKYESLSQKVYNTFLKPVIPFVSGDKIGFIPHGAVYYLPFAAMTHKRQYLVDGFSIFYLPGAAVLKYVMKREPLKSFNVLAFGNPDLGNKKLDLPFAEAEVESIKKIIPQATVFIRSEATEKKAKEIAGRYDIVHFAVHGLYAGDAPLNSALLLASGGKYDGSLMLNEIMKLRFKGRLMIVSGSKVAPSVDSNGMEIMGFNRSFLYAGSPSVLTTLWNVEDNSKSVFMGIFYKTIQKNESIADSLAETQGEMIKLGYEPYHWAAYILSGKY